MFQADSCTEDENKEKYVSLSDRVNDMVETVKHAIVLLQIAKVGNSNYLDKMVLIIINTRFELSYPDINNDYF